MKHTKKGLFLVRRATPTLAVHVDDCPKRFHKGFRLFLQKATRAPAHLCAC